MARPLAPQFYLFPIKNRLDLNSPTPRQTTLVSQIAAGQTLCPVRLWLIIDRITLGINSVERANESHCAFPSRMNHTPHVYMLNTADYRSDCSRC